MLPSMEESRTSVPSVVVVVGATVVVVVEVVVVVVGAAVVVVVEGTVVVVGATVVVVATVLELKTVSLPESLPVQAERAAVRPTLIPITMKILRTLFPPDHQQWASRPLQSL